MKNNTLYTIGFTKKKAEQFFRIIQNAGIEKIIDVRLNNVSQLAGFAKRDDLKYFLRTICNCGYIHEPLLAPTKDILDDYKKKKIDWQTYENRFDNLINSRLVSKRFSLSDLRMSCLLCSEHTADHCHRRLVAQYFKRHFDDLEICHL